MPCVRLYLRITCLPQSLEHVAAYWYGADWIQMWGANPEITVPDSLPDNALLRLGYLAHVYVRSSMHRGSAQDDACVDDLL